MMSTYIEIPVEDIELDKSNPRIARGIAYYGENITSETMALLLGSTSEACASLRESIRENGGIIHPIVVNKRTGNSYVVIEGNTRLQIYKDFIKNGVPGNWTTIRAIVYDNLDTERIHAIRLQAHLIGPREWDPYSKAMYLHYLADVEHMPMATLISFCGGNSKASEIRNMIAAYNDMETYYRPLCDDDTQFDHRNFHGFVELQRKNVIDEIALKKNEALLDNPKYVFRKYFIRGKDEVILKILHNYFSAAADVFPHEWNNPKDFILTKSVGFEGLISALSVLVPNGETKGDLSKQRFVSVFEQLKLKLSIENIQLSSKYFSSSSQDAKRLSQMIIAAEGLLH